MAGFLHSIRRAARSHRPHSHWSIPQVSSPRNLLSQEELDFLLAPPAKDGSCDMPEEEDRHEDMLDMDLEEERGDGDTKDERADETPDQTVAGTEDDFADEHETDSARGVSGLTPGHSERLFAALLEKELVRLTQAYVRVDALAVRTMSCLTLMKSLEEPAAFVLLSSLPLAARLLFHCDATLTRTLADVSLGAGTFTPGARPLTALDRTLVRRLLAVLPTCVEDAWNVPRADLRRLVEEAGDIFLTEHPERVRVATFAMEIGSARGQCLLAWPEKR